MTTTQQPPSAHALRTAHLTDSQSCAGYVLVLEAQSLVVSATEDALQEPTGESGESGSLVAVATTAAALTLSRRSPPLRFVRTFFGAIKACRSTCLRFTGTIKTLCIAILRERCCAPAEVVVALRKADTS